MTIKQDKNKENNNNNNNNNNNSELSKEQNIAGYSDITNLGSTKRDFTDTGDVARASISKGMETQKDISAVDIVKGDAVAESTQGIIRPDKNRTKNSNVTVQRDEDTDKIVKRGTTSDKSAGIDKAGMYSHDDARHIDRGQEKPVEKVQDGDNTGSWKIREKEREE